MPCVEECTTAGYPVVKVAASEYIKRKYCKSSSDEGMPRRRFGRIQNILLIGLAVNTLKILYNISIAYQLVKK